MKNLTLKDLEKHQDETLNTLYKEYEEAWKKYEELGKKIDIIMSAIERFQTQIFIAQQFDKEERKN